MQNRYMKKIIRENEPNEDVNFVYREISSKEIYKKLWRQARDYADFKKLLRMCPLTCYNYLSAIYYFNDDWKLRRQFLGDRVFKTYSDAGSVLVGNSNFSVAFRNYHGDGVTRVAVINECEKMINLFIYDTEIQVTSDDVHIYDYDCADTMYDEKIAYTFKKGRYSVWHYDGIVVFASYNGDVEEEKETDGEIPFN